MRMKNKKSEQIAAKQKHIARFRSDRRKAPILERPAAYLAEKPSILIVCEGENTEPSYFNQFRIYSATVKSVGEGYNTIYQFDHSNPALEESSTTVFKLAEELLKH